MSDDMNHRNDQAQADAGAQLRYQAQLDRGHFLIQRCADCAHAVFYPREACPYCGSASLRWEPPSGLGTVHSVTVVRRKPEAGGSLNVALVDLDEGVRLMSRVEGLEPEAVSIGLRVRSRVSTEQGRGLLVFDPLVEPGAPAASAPAVFGAPAVVVAPAVHVPSDARALRGGVAIAGAATFGCGESPGLDDMALLARAAHAAVADAGLTLKDIDGLCTASVSATMWTLPVIEQFGLDPRYIDGTMLGGSSFVAHLLPAMRALQAGQCQAVLVCYGSAQRSAAHGRKEIVAARRFLDPQPFEHPYQPLLPVSAYALAAARHMHQFGTTRRQLAEVAVAARQWARLNPEAFMREPLSIDDVLSARMVSDPLGVRDCCLVTDGAGALVLVRADRAKDLRQPPVHVLGSATAAWHRQVSSMPDLTLTAARKSAAEAFAMAALGPRDMDMAQLYDAFTINTLLFLEDLGFCGKGEGGAFVENGAIAPGGRLAVNTNGGGLSCVHPGMYGIFALIEAVRQLRGQAGARQLQKARTAIVHANGGTLSSQASAVLGTADAL